MLLEESKHLLTEVGTAVNKDEVRLSSLGINVGLQQSRTSTTLVSRVPTAAHATLASHLWDTNGGTGAEEVEFHVPEFFRALLI